MPIHAVATVPMPKSKLFLLESGDMFRVLFSKFWNGDLRTESNLRKG